MPAMGDGQFDIPKEQIASFCQKWQIKEFSLFGSILRADFRPDSDVDVLILLQENAPWDLFDWVDMLEELKVLFGREVDLVEQSAIDNPFRRWQIFKTRRVIYAA
jgi:uncharacterized protein